MHVGAVLFSKLIGTVLFDESSIEIMWTTVELFCSELIVVYMDYFIQYTDSGVWGLFLFRTLIVVYRDYFYSVHYEWHRGTIFIQDTNSGI